MFAADAAVVSANLASPPFSLHSLYSLPFCGELTEETEKWNWKQNDQVSLCLVFCDVPTFSVCVQKHSFLG